VNDGDFVSAGGLTSHGPDASESYQQGINAGEILTGAKPGDLPIPQPNKLQLAINQRSALGLGMTIPKSLLLRATETID
jgi:putative ABC transport system substrate-binding protein